MLTHLSDSARRVVCTLGLLLCTVGATPTWASAIYEFREPGTSAVIGTLEITSPPADLTTGWSTTDPSDLIALYLADSVFHLGTGNLLATATPTSVALLSLDGSTLDIGSLAFAFPTILPINQGDPTIDRFLSFVPGVPGGTDFIGLSVIRAFPGGSVVIEDSFSYGDFQAAAVPEPGTASLVLLGLAAAGRRIARRKRR